MYRASYCNVHIDQRDEQILVNNLYFFVNRFYMFRTIISPSSGATFNKLYSAIGTFVQVRLAAASQTYRLTKKIKIIHKNLCISLVYIHIFPKHLTYKHF